MNMEPTKTQTLRRRWRLAESEHSELSAHSASR